MNDISDASTISALRREMNRAVARQVASAGNLANLETPGYRAREPEFSDALANSLGDATALRTTNPSHIQTVSTGAGAVSTPTKETDGLTFRRDGNNVQLDRELLNMVEASGQFAKAQTALAAKFRLVRYAISEGR